MSDADGGDLLDGVTVEVETCEYFYQQGQTYRVTVTHLSGVSAVWEARDPFWAEMKARADVRAVLMEALRHPDRLAAWNRHAAAAQRP